jgi:hypothetical protein
MDSKTLEIRPESNEIVIPNRYHVKMYSQQMQHECSQILNYSNVDFDLLKRRIIIIQQVLYLVLYKVEKV